MMVKGGFTNYGEPIGILMLETRFARPAGDIGNASTFDFPVRYEVVRGASPARVVSQGDPALIEPFIEGARRLEAAGVKAITTSCGFLALFQERIAAALSVPFFSSSLLQIPLAHRLSGGRGAVGVLTVSKASLSAAHLRAVGAEGVPVVIGGMDASPEFARVFMNSSLEGPADSFDLDFDTAAAEVEAAARRLVADDRPDAAGGFRKADGCLKGGGGELRSIVLECTNLPPFREFVRRATRLPVFDIVTLVNYIRSAL